MNKKSTFLSMSSFVLVISICIGMFCPIVIWAQIDTTKTQQLKEVQINAKKLNQILNSPSPIQILGGDDLKRMNSLSVADAIRYFSGVQLKDYGGVGGLKTVNVRSMGTNHTAVFYNGIQLSNAQNGQVDLGKYALDNLEEITLLSGQNNELLQPAKVYASASGIFLKTKSPLFTPDKNYSLNASIKAGDFGLINPGILYQQKLNDKISVSLSSEYILANGKYKFRYTNGVYDTTATRNNGDVERFRLEASLFGKLKSGKWYTQIYSFLSDRGLPGAIIANKFDYNQRIWDRNLFVQSSVEQNINKKLSILANAKLSYDYTRFLDPEYITLNGFLDNRFHEREAYFSIAANYKITNHWNVALSSDYQYQDLKANIYRFAYPDRNSFLNVVSTAYQTDRLQLQANILSTTIIDNVKEYASAGSKQVFSPTILFSYQLFSKKNLRIRGFYKDIFRMPTFNDLYYTFIGNSLLKPEFTKQYDLGFTYAALFKNDNILPLEIQADAYYNQVTDKIVAQPGANLIRWIMYNIGKVDIKGLEVNLKSGFKIKQEIIISTGLNYTYQNAIDITDKTEESYQDQIPYIPKHSGSFLARVDYRNLKLNYSFIYTGFRYNQKANIIYNYMEPWYTHDVGFGYQFKLKKGSIDLNGEVNNLLNQYYDVIPNFPMPGRNYRFTLKYSL